MPVWIQVILLTGAVVAALATIWKQVVAPLLKFTHALDEMVPVLKSLTEVFADTPHAFEILDEIVAQFRSDSGSTLRDAVNRLEESANKSELAAVALDINRLAMEKAAVTDREQLALLVQKLDRLTVKVDGLAP